MRGRRVRRTEIDPFAVLGLTATATVEEVELARRTLAKSAHPDIGGSVADMQLVNAAADEATRRIRGSAVAPTTSGQPSPRSGSTASDPGRPRFGRRDHPSFTVEALPVEAFEALLIVAGWLGDLIDDEPPYALEVALTQPIAGWCRLDLVPDAGASTVSVSVAGEPGEPPPDLDVVRDAWIAGLNQLDWAELGGDRPQP